MRKNTQLRLPSMLWDPTVANDQTGRNVERLLGWKLCKLDTHSNPPSTGDFQSRRNPVEVKLRLRGFRIRKKKKGRPNPWSGLFVFFKPVFEGWSVEVLVSPLHMQHRGSSHLMIFPLILLTKVCVLANVTSSLYLWVWSVCFLKCFPVKITVLGKCMC